MQSTLASCSISNGRNFCLCSSAVLGKGWMSFSCLTLHPGSLDCLTSQAIIKLGDPLYLCLVKILLHCQHLKPDNNSGVRRSHHIPEATSIDFKYCVYFISASFRKECGWVTLTVYYVI